MSNENEFLQIVVKNIIRSEVLVFRLAVRGLCSGVFWRRVFFFCKKTDSGKRMDADAEALAAVFA